MNKKLKSEYLLAFFFMLFWFCSCRSNVTITRDSIYSSDWANSDYQGFQIAKIKLLDTTISVFDKDFNRFQLSRYIIDSSFCYGAGRNYNDPNKMPKIYFDRDSESFDWYKCGNIMQLKKRIGLLQLNTWYVILGMRGSIDYYVYIDFAGDSHVYSLGPTNS